MSVSAGIEMRGWRFERQEDGLVRIEKERLVADSILLDEGEWEEIVAALWVPGQDVDKEDDEWGDDEPV